MTKVSIDVRGLPAVRRLLATTDDRERLNRERRGVRAAGNVFKKGLAAAARARHGSGSGNVPASFAKVRVRVSTSNRRGRQPTAIVRPRSPLFNIFEPGAGIHSIAPKASTELAGQAGAGSWSSAGRKRRSAFYAHGPVHHPGMSSRALLPGVFSTDVAVATEAAASIIFGQSLGAVLGSGE